MSLLCPRCQGTVERQVETFKVAGHDYPFPRYVCPSCYTAFFFYENVVEIIAALTKERKEA